MQKMTLNVKITSNYFRVVWTNRNFDGKMLKRNLSKIPNISSFSKDIHIYAKDS
jgi:hypothetical protein